MTSLVKSRDILTLGKKYPIKPIVKMKDPIFSDIDGDPIDALMRQDEIHRWTAIALLLAERNWSYRLIGESLGCGWTHVRLVAKGERQDERVKAAIANKLGLPRAQVFPEVVS